MNIQAKPYVGQHCETTATGTLLKNIGIALSEPMLFGLGQGLSFIYWNMKSMDFPFIGGRVKPDLLTANLCKALNLKLYVKETSSVGKAWQGVKDLLDNGTAVGLKLDCYHLEYFTNPVHFAGHYVAMLGYDENTAFLVDTEQQGSTVTTSLKSLELARKEKGSMSSKNLYYSIEREADMPDLKEAVLHAIRENSQSYLNPPITNLNYKGIKKASTQIIKWFDESENVQEEFATSAMLMDRGGTGGAIFRNFYRDFLSEAYELTGVEAIAQARDAFADIAKDWSTVIQLFEMTGKTGEKAYVLEASEKMKGISSAEKSAMEMLQAT